MQQRCTNLTTTKGCAVKISSSRPRESCLARCTACLATSHWQRRIRYAIGSSYKDKELIFIAGIHYACALWIRSLFFSFLFAPPPSAEAHHPGAAPPRWRAAAVVSCHGGQVRVRGPLKGSPLIHFSNPFPPPPSPRPRRERPSYARSWSAVYHLRP